MVYLILLLTATYTETLEIPLLGKVYVSIFQNYTVTPLNFTINLTPSSIIISSNANLSQFNFYSNSTVNLSLNRIIIPIYQLNSTIKIILQNKSYYVLILIQANFLNFSNNKNITRFPYTDNNTGNNIFNILTPINLIIVISIISIILSIIIRILRRTE